MATPAEQSSAGGAPEGASRRAGIKGSGNGEGDVLPHVRRSSVTESDGYSRSVAGVDIDVIRTGRGFRPTEIHGAVARRWAGSSLRIGFPVFARTVLGSDVLGVAVIERALPGMRWCGMDLRTGDVVVYSPEAHQLPIQKRIMENATRWPKQGSPAGSP